MNAGLGSDGRGPGDTAAWDADARLATLMDHPRFPIRRAFQMFRGSCGDDSRAPLEMPRREANEGDI